MRTSRASTRLNGADGLRVVRLKGGDPSVFGRVSEESAFLRGHGVPVEIVPGVTAACAAAAQFDFPLTHRGLARRVVFTTATVRDGALAADWSAGADREATLAIYMGGAATAEMSERLIAAGRCPSTPILVIQDVGGPQSRIGRQRLRDLARPRPGAAMGPSSSSSARWPHWRTSAQRWEPAPRPGPAAVRRRPETS